MLCHVGCWCIILAFVCWNKSSLSLRLVFQVDRFFRHDFREVISLVSGLHCFREAPWPPCLGMCPSPPAACKVFFAGELRMISAWFPHVSFSLGLLTSLGPWVHNFHQVLENVIITSSNLFLSHPSLPSVSSITHVFLSFFLREEGLFASVSL